MEGSIAHMVVCGAQPTHRLIFTDETVFFMFAAVHMGFGHVLLTRQFLLKPFDPIPRFVLRYCFRIKTCKLLISVSTLLVQRPFHWDAMYLTSLKLARYFKYTMSICLRVQLWVRSAVADENYDGISWLIEYIKNVGLWRLEKASKSDMVSQNCPKKFSRIWLQPRRTRASFFLALHTDI